MKKINILISLIIFIYFISIASAISATLKESYSPKETIIAEISGNILGSLSSDNIEFKRGNVRVPLEYELKKLDNKYFLWFVAPESQNNYTLIINNIETTISGKNEEIDFSQNFSVLGNLSSYTIKPGAILANEDFEISVFLNEDFEKIVSISAPETHEVSIKPGENKIKFKFSDFEKNKILGIDLGIYKIPIFLISDEKNSDLQILRFSPRTIEKIFLSSDEELDYIFSLDNLQNKKLENIELFYDKEKFKISPDKFSLAPKESISLTLKIKGGDGDKIEDFVYAKYKNDSIPLYLDIRFSDNPEEELDFINNSENSSIKGYYCHELEGKLCSAGETCEGKTKQSLDGIKGVCCIGKCVIPKKSNSWIGYLIALILTGAVIFIWFKYRKVKPETNPVAKIALESKKENIP